jgi:hypothetical protein
MGIVAAGLAGALLWPAASPAGAQAVVTSPGPDRVAVTFYRDPYRPASQSLDLSWLSGFALISETRQVSIPAGESEIRFEGVAGGIVPQSAIVTGLSEGIVERNRDAYLLSPRTILERSLGRRVHLRRTSLATGQVREQEAIVRSGADGAVVLQTAQGFEALRCTGLAETLVYDEVPPGLSARPTLSVRTRSRAPVSATVTLSYLASGFDWEAYYVAELSADGRSIDLFAWLTLASMDETSFVEADAQAVAGRLNREHAEVPPVEAGALELRCWPEAATDEIPEFVTVVESQEVRLAGTTRTEDLINALPQAFAASQEELGDLKLYRLPEPVTVAANSQKQVALLARSDVQVEFVYRVRLYPEYAHGPEPADRYLLTRNRAAEGLGLPLPAGGFALFVEAGGRPILIGQGHVRDRAVGEDVEVPLGEAPSVRTEVTLVRDGERTDEYLLTVSNDRAEPAEFEAEFDAHSEQRFRSGRRLDRRDGRPLWAVTVPANGRATFRYRVRSENRPNK